MDGVSWSTSRAPESFSRSRAAATTLSRLASFIARAETRQQARSQRPPPPGHLPHVCQECGKGFAYATDLLHHQDVKHTLPKPHRCPACGQEFSLKSSLQLHKCGQDSARCPLCHGEPRLPSPCAACMTRVSDPGKPQSPHRQPHLLDRSPYACAPCGRGFSQKQALLQHQQAGCSEPPSPSHGGAGCSGGGAGIGGGGGSPADDSPPASEGDSGRSDSSDTPGPSSRSETACHFCFRTFRSESGLQRHLLTTHGEEQPKAPQGLKTKEHGPGGEARRGEHPKVSREPKEVLKAQRRPLSCRSCDMVFRSTSKLYRHRKERHSREKQVLREPRPVASKKHRKGFTYPCQVCGKLFVHHLSLRAHCRQHAAAAATSSGSTRAAGGGAKHPAALEDRPNRAKRLACNKVAKAGPGRPRKVARVEIRVADPRGRREAPDAQEELDGEFPCPSCAEVFPLQSQLREHVELHQSSARTRRCSVCTDEMDACRWPGSRRQRLYHCVPCMQGFSALDSFLEHCQEHLRVKVEEDSMADGGAAAGKA